MTGRDGATPRGERQRCAERKPKSPAVYDNIATAAAVLRSGEWRGSFRYDEMRHGVRLMRPLTVSRGSASGESRMLEDHDVLVALERLQIDGLPKLTLGTMQAAIDLVGREMPVHPLRDWLRQLQWDGTPRLGMVLPMLFGAAPGTYSEMVGKFFFTSLVARVERPGCQVDNVPVLVGPQGIGKSGAMRLLAGDEFFSDHLPTELDGKDAALHLAGKWIVEMSELVATMKSSPETTKAFVTRRIDRYRPPYGRREVDVARQCVLVGTTNEQAFLRDPTGGRRFWPVAVARIDFDGLARDREQLFAEAVELYREDRPWWPDATLERDFFKPEQDGRAVGDPWDDIIAKHLADKTDVTIMELARDAVGLEQRNVGTVHQRRIGAALERFGWRRGKRGSGGWIWLPPQ
jgi:predicted P-loop ATPase